LQIENLDEEARGERGPKVAAAALASMILSLNQKVGMVRRDDAAAGAERLM
jgi:hypothetical protein